jgi:hypothetical protein
LFFLLDFLGGCYLGSGQECRHQTPLTFHRPLPRVWQLLYACDQRGMALVGGPHLSHYVLTRSGFPPTNVGTCNKKQNIYIFKSLCRRIIFLFFSFLFIPYTREYFLHRAVSIMSKMPCSLRLLILTPNRVGSSTPTRDLIEGTRPWTLKGNLDKIFLIVVFKKWV